MSDAVRNILRFFVIILLQVVVLDKVTLQWWLQPAGFPVFIPLVYPLFILLLPFETPVWALLIIGFITGFTVDVFMSTAGMHACAAVLLAYLRTNVLNALLSRNLSDYVNQSPSIKNMGWIPFLVYSGFLLLLHHILFYSIELWNLSNIGFLILKIVASLFTSMMFVIIYLLLFTRQSGARV